MAQNEEKSVFLNFMAGMGLGALVGAATALLLAPKSGPETREDLKKAAQDLSQSTEEFRKRSMELLDAAKTKATEAYEAGKETIQKRRVGEETGESVPEA